MRVVASSLFAFRQQELRRKQHHRRHQQQHHARERKRRRNRCAIASTLATKTTESPPLEYYEHTKIPSTEFTETCHGPEEYTSVLLHAMRMQWKHGFTHVPNGFRRVTHGFGEILAGMQPAAAERCVELLLRRGEAEDDDHDTSKTENKESVLDPFCGGGTVPVVAMTNGLIAYGTDVSPLALHVCGHRVWVPENVDEEETWLRERMKKIEAIVADEKDADENVNPLGSFASIAVAVEKAISVESEDDESNSSSSGNESNSNSIDSTTRKTALFFCLAEAERRHFVRQKRNKRKKTVREATRDEQW